MFGSEKMDHARMGDTRYNSQSWRRGQAESEDVMLRFKKGDATIQESNISKKMAKRNYLLEVSANEGNFKLCIAGISETSPWT